MHDLCRVGARDQLRAGLSVHEIIAMGRWKTASMVYRYGIQDERDINASAAKLAAALAAAER